MASSYGIVQRGVRRKPLDQRSSYMKEHGLCEAGALLALCISLLATQEPLDLAKVHDT